MSSNEELEALNDADLSREKGKSRAPRIVGGLNHVRTKPLGEQPRAVRRQELMVVLGNLGVLATGLGLGLPSVTLKQLTDPKEHIYLDPSQASWYSSLNMFSSPLGGLLSSYFLDRLGRKNSLYVLNVISLTAWMLMALAVQDDAETVYIQLLISRFLIGLSTGLASAPVGVYSAEISMPKIRGRLILGSSIAVATGITFVYILGYIIRNDWHLIAYILCAYQLISLILVIPMPETPSWLLSKGRVEEAKQSLNYFRGLDKIDIITNEEVLAEFKVLQKSIQLAEGQKKPSFLTSVRLPEVYKPLLILMGLFAFQQITGIFVVIVYAVQISMEAGVSIDPFMCAVFIGVARLVTSCAMGVVLEKWGRRRSGIISALGMAVCMFLLAGHGWYPWLQRIPFLASIAIVAFIILSTLGIFTLPFFMISELFPQKVRGSASGLTVAVGMLISFVCIKTYPNLKEKLGGEVTFAFYGVMSVLAMVFVYFLLPETRGRTLLEIEEQFRSGKWRQGGKRRHVPPPVEMREVSAI